VHAHVKTLATGEQVIVDAHVSGGLDEALRAHEALRADEALRAA
jgi:hypothetical protein